MLGSLQDNDIKLLRMSHVIAQCGGFSTAQAQLNMSQSAISTQMAHLETRLGYRLCERGRGVFRLTDEGQKVIRASETLFGALEDFRTDLSESMGRLSGELRVGLIDNSVTHDNPLIRDAIGQFVGVAPDATISIYVGGAVELEQQVLDNRLHIAIGLFHHNVETLSYVPLFDERHELYCARTHPFFNRNDSEISEEELIAARYVSWGYGEGVPGWNPPFAFNAVASSAHVEGVAHLVLSGLYLGYLPTHYASGWLSQGQLRSLMQSQTRRVTQFSLIKKKSARTSGLVRAFLDALGIDQEN